MKINTTKFRLIYAFQMLLLVADLFLNTFSITYKKHHSVILILFIVQDFCLILGLVLLLLMFFSTFVFQAGLMDLLYDRFRLTICICIFYLVLTTILYIWILCTISQSLEDFWSPLFIIYYAFQRIYSPLYYYSYKRAALKICDPQFHEDVIWEQNSINN